MYIYKEGMSLEEQKDGAYWERNMLALAYANRVNALMDSRFSMLGVPKEERPIICGWYKHGEWKGWSRVISLDVGSITFHVPDDFDLGDLPEIQPNWDGHTTEEKWLDIMKRCGVNHD